MKPQTYLNLRALHELHGPREFGKLAQKLLALSLREAGCTHIVERGVQGVDVDATWDHDRYAIEAKTTIGLGILFGKKDVEGLAARGSDGYRPILAVLRLGLLAQWYFADASVLTAGALTLDSLRPYRFRGLELRLQPLFEQVVAQHFHNTLAGSQAYLDEALAIAKHDL